MLGWMDIVLLIWIVYCLPRIVGLSIDLHRVTKEYRMAKKIKRLRLSESIPAVVAERLMGNSTGFSHGVDRWATPAAGAGFSSGEGHGSHSWGPVEGYAEITPNGRTILSRRKLRPMLRMRRTRPMKYVVIRARQAGVFTGYLEAEEKNATVILQQARRVLSWKGAASISQLAASGSARPKDCQFREPVLRCQIQEVVEILECTKEAQECLEAIPY